MIYPHLQPTEHNKFELLEEYVYEIIKVPAGYTTNGANIPRIFWSFIPPFKPKYLPAVLVHDFLIEAAKNKKEIDLANDYFEEILLQIENSFKTKTMIFAVKTYWKYKYKKEGKL